METSAVRGPFLFFQRVLCIKWFSSLVKGSFMLQNNKGYLLLESMLSLMLFSAIASICLPFVYILHQEQKTTKQLLYAIEEADRISINKIQMPDKEWKRNGVLFSSITKRGVTDEYEICIRFEASNKKEYTACSSYY
jgi:hypothetical protein